MVLSRLPAFSVSRLGIRCFSFIVEYILGLKLVDGGESYEISPHMMRLEEIEARIPVKNGWLDVKVKDGIVTSQII
jgi:hypothetical protein